MSDFITRLKIELEKELPGKEVQYRMAPSDRVALDLESQKELFRESSVVVLLFFKQDKLHLLLTQRASYKGVHGGQISFPGGKFDPQQDQNLIDTAQREVWEEISLCKSAYQIVGKITPLRIPVSKMLVHPFVAFADSVDIAKPDLYEITDLYQVSIEHLKSPQNLKWTNDKGVKYPYFDYQGKEIWGATAMIINELLEILSFV